MDDSKPCSMCKTTLPLEAFYKSSASKTGRQSRCKACQSNVQKQEIALNPDKFRQAWKAARQKNQAAINAKSRSYYWSNKEKLAEKKRQYQKQNLEIYRLGVAKRRAIKKQAFVYTVTKSDLKKLMSRPCLYCGAVAEHLDHIIPLARGGNHGVGNLAPSCASCNISKKDRYITEWKMSGCKDIIQTRKKEGENG